VSLFIWPFYLLLQFSTPIRFLGGPHGQTEEPFNAGNLTVDLPISRHRLSERVMQYYAI